MIKKEFIRTSNIPKRSDLTKAVRRLSKIPVKNRLQRIRSPKLNLTGESLKICVQRKLGGLGDILMTTPTVNTLRAMYPDAEITYATDPGLFFLLQNNPDIDIVEDFRKISPVNYDFFVDVSAVCPPFEAFGKPPINRINIFALKTGIVLKDPKPVYVVSDEEKRWASQWLANQWGNRSDYRLVVLSVSSVDPKRSWPVEYSHELINLLNASQNNLKFFVDDFNNKGGEWNHLNTVSKRFGFRQFAAIMNECDLFIGPDSGPLHLAGALEKPIVAIFGSTDPEARINHYINAVAAVHKLSCGFCWYSRCDYKNACFTELKPNKVLPLCLAKLSSAINPKIFNYSIEIDGVLNEIVEGFKKVSEFYPGCKSGSFANSIHIDIITADSKVAKQKPSDYHVCYFIQNKNDIGLDYNLYLNKNYDLILCDSQRTLDNLWDIGIRKPMYVVLPPLVQNLAERPQVDLDPYSDNINLYQCLMQGKPVVVHTDSAINVPESFLLRTEELTDEIKSELSYDSFIQEWAIKAFTKDSIERILTIISNKL